MQFVMIIVNVNVANIPNGQKFLGSLNNDIQPREKKRVYDGQA